MLNTEWGLVRVRPLKDKALTTEDPSQTDAMPVHISPLLLDLPQTCGGDHLKDRKRNTCREEGKGHGRGS